MSARDDTPEERPPGAPEGGRGRAGADDPERRPLGYYYDDGTNYETYDPDRDEEPQPPEGETGADS